VISAILAQTILEARAACLHGQKPSVEPGGGSITDQIGKLAELHKSGILSGDEFSEKKTGLLKRL
jgi:hypothetical protein